VSTRYPPWRASELQAVCDVLAQTGWPGLTNTEIGRLLAQLRISDIHPNPPNKRERLYAALANRQNNDQASNRLITFINEAMAPGRHLQDQHRFEALRDGLSEALALLGYKVNEEGKVAHARKAATLDEVARLAGRLRTELRRRGVHPDVVKYCEEELLRKSLFHAVFEATKGLAERLRELSGSTQDGAALVDYCFGTQAGIPVIRVNGLRTESEISEHRGFANLLRGVFGTFRNPPAHTPRAATDWAISEPDALDLFSMLSLVHRRLDTVTVTRP
jgi:uncharacterized protein (TIGR02391 family)